MLAWKSIKQLKRKGKNLVKDKYFNKENVILNESHIANKKIKISRPSANTLKGKISSKSRLKKRISGDNNSKKTNITK